MFYIVHLNYVKMYYVINIISLTSTCFPTPIPLPSVLLFLTGTLLMQLLLVSMSF